MSILFLFHFLEVAHFMYNCFGKEVNPLNNNFFFPDSFQNGLKQTMSINPDIFKELIPVFEYMDQLHKIMAPIEEIAGIIAEAIKVSIPENILEIQETMRRFAEMWNEYVTSCLPDTSNTYKPTYYPNTSESVLDDQVNVDVKHSNSPPVRTTLLEQAKINFRDNITMYRNSKAWNSIKSASKYLLKLIFDYLFIKLLFPD